MRIRNLFLFACLLLSPLAGFAASDFSYVYIQGDKQTPFYVKLEDGMQPRYGKNYCILSKLAPGPAHIEILFQQNAFPAQQFVIQVPESGSRQFMIVRREGVFNLYDLQQNFYLPAGNKIEDDHVPAIAAPVARIEPVAVETPKPRREPVAKEVPLKKKQPVVADDPIDSEPNAFNAGVKKAGAAISKGADKSAAFARKAVEPLRPSQTAGSDPQRPLKTDGKPDFIGNMELSTPNTDPSVIPVTRSNSSTPTATTVKPPIVNSDCPNPATAPEFGKVFNGLSSYSTDEDRLEYIGKHLDKCYETWHARTLAGKFEGDAGRYEMLRKIYPRITDQGSFALLDDLLTAPAWKDAFNRLVNRQ